MADEPRKPTFKPGKNIAMKVPAHLYEGTVRFYRDVLELKPLTEHLPNVCFEFGGKNLWIDNIPQLSRSEIWLEIEADDLEEAAQYFEKIGVVRCDAIEKLPPGHKGFWIMDPVLHGHPCV